jgi:hypothetical protein
MLPSTTSSSPSRSIPINTNTSQSRRLARADEAFLREAALADYVDFCFATRLVHGMQKRQTMTHDISLRYENQALIDHIIATRQSRFEHLDQRSSATTVFQTTGSRKYHRITPERRDSNENLRKLRSLNEEKQHEDEDEMIFALEL